MLCNGNAGEQILVFHCLLHSCSLAAGLSLTSLGTAVCLPILKQGDGGRVPAFHTLPCLSQMDAPKAECFETLSAMELAEQITLLDHVVFRSIPYE